MFVRNTVVALLVVLTFSTVANAQLFRFGRRLNNQYNYGQSSSYNPATTRYTQQATAANYIPSQRNCQQRQYQAYQTQTRPQSYAIAQQPATQPTIYVVTYVDPYTGRTYQRQYLMQNPTSPAKPAADTKEQKSDQQLAGSPSDDLPQLKTQSASKIPAANSPGSVLQTSLEETPNESGYSVFEANRIEDSVPGQSVLDAELPALELQGDSAQPTTPKPIPTNNLEVDLPALAPNGGRN